MNKETDGERYFVAGLLHDIGRLIMCLKIPANSALLWTLPAKVEIAGTRLRQNILVLIMVVLEVLCLDLEICKNGYRKVLNTIIILQQQKTMAMKLRLFFCRSYQPRNR
jgi:hypothetical protein